MNNLRRFLTQSLSSRRHDFMRICLIMLVIFGFGALSVRAEYFYVATNGNHTTFRTWAEAATNIQDAVNIAINSGDIVWVSNGVYSAPAVIGGAVTNVLVLSNANVTVKSVNGPSVTVIDGGYPAKQWRCVYINAASTTLNGFSIRNGYGGTVNNGAGIDIDVVNGVIVTNCIVHNNIGYSGGGIYVYYSSATIANCIIYSNACYAYGGGISLSAGGASVVDHCVFFENATWWVGGWGGGAVNMNDMSGSIRNSLFYRNSSANGGALWIHAAGVNQIENCTFVANTGTVSGGGIGILADSPNNQLRNLVIYDNSAPINADVNITNAAMTNCCVKDMTGVPNWDTSGNITNNPIFVDAANYNYRLKENSPCINTGMNQSWMTGAVDLDGHRRIDFLGGRVDIGAYEFLCSGTIYCVY